MLDTIIENAPAKINLFLKILNKRNDGYHNIRSGITFINLYDKIEAKKSKSFDLQYNGDFAPPNKIFNKCIIEKLFKIIKIKKPCYKFTITKNIPIQSGLGSASSNAAAVIRILQRLELIDYSYNEKYFSIGADVPLFINQNDCLIRKKGENIINLTFPKYFFLLVKPKLNCSTTMMYNQIISDHLNYNLEHDNEKINEYDVGNDFEKIVLKNLEVKKIFNFLENLDDVIFVRLTGSGSCCYAVFENLDSAKNAKIKLKKSFPELWNIIAENNNVII